MSFFERGFKKNSKKKGRPPGRPCGMSSAWTLVRPTNGMSEWFRMDAEQQMILNHKFHIRVWFNQYTDVLMIFFMLKNVNGLVHVVKAVAKKPCGPGISGGVSWENVIFPLRRGWSPWPAECRNVTFQILTLPHRIRDRIWYCIEFCLNFQIECRKGLIEWQGVWKHGKWKARMSESSPKCLGERPVKTTF